MPDYEINGVVLDIPRNAVLVDTGVLVAAFYRREAIGRHQYAKGFLEQSPVPILLPSLVIGEAWGVIHRKLPKETSRLDALSMVSWALSPTNGAYHIPCTGLRTSSINETLTKFEVDLVDAVLVEIAIDIATKLQIKTGLPIATYDTRDFWILSAQPDAKFEVMDMAQEPV